MLTNKSVRFSRRIDCTYWLRQIWLTISDQFRTELRESVKLVKSWERSESTIVRQREVTCPSHRNSWRTNASISSREGGRERRTREEHRKDTRKLENHVSKSLEAIQQICVQRQLHRHCYAVKYRTLVMRSVSRYCNEFRAMTEVSSSTSTIVIEFKDHLSNSSHLKHWANWKRWNCDPTRERVARQKSEREVSCDSSIRQRHTTFSRNTSRLDHTCSSWCVYLWWASATTSQRIPSMMYILIWYWKSEGQILRSTEVINETC